MAKNTGNKGGRPHMVRTWRTMHREGVHWIVTSHALWDNGRVTTYGWKFCYTWLGAKLSTIGRSRG